MGVIDHRRMASLDRRGLIGTIYLGGQLDISCGPHGFKEETYCLSNYKSMRVLSFHGISSYNPISSRP